MSGLAERSNPLQKPVLTQESSSTGHCGERKIGALGDIEQAVPAVRQVEHPQHVHDAWSGVPVAADCTVEATFAKIGLAFGQSVFESEVVLNNLDELRNDAEGRLEMPWRNEVQVVRRRMVFGKRSKPASLKETHGQIESR